MRKQRLELDWVGKDDSPRLEPRILIEDPDFSYADSSAENKLIHGDNLLALKALEQDYTGRFNCIYIDPPYNTGNAFQHYDDGLEHSIWLSLMRDRVLLLHKLLANDGFFCCQIDESEGPYLKVLLDEVFGRNNYMTTFYVQVRYGNKTLAEDNDYQKLVEQIFIYAKDASKAKPIKEKEPYKIDKFVWVIDELEKGETLELGGKTVEIFKPHQYSITKKEPFLAGLKETWATGSLIKQKASSGEFLDKHLAPRKSVDGLKCLYKVHGIGEDGLGYRYMTGPKKETATKGKFYSGIPLSRLAELENGKATKEKPILNFYDLSAQFGNCRHEGEVDFRGGKKPERLIEILLSHFSKEGDLVLDSFAGSGTTAAVAHKMKRNWVTIELGDHCKSHCFPRLKRVVSGEDQSGVSTSQGWKGGGGFKFYDLAPSLLQKDERGQWIISPKYDATQLSHALCKHEGFKFWPDKEFYWKHGFSTEKDFIFVTTEFLTSERLDKIASQLKEDESLLICAKAFRVSKEKYKNISIKKIPQMLLGRCEFGKEDYSLNVDESYQEEMDFDGV